MATILEGEGYTSLAIALQGAYLQATQGKGTLRHNPHGYGFMAQPIMTITDSVGIGFPIGQAMKKSQEAATMVDRGLGDAAIRELQGAIVYLAAAIIHLEEINA